MTSTIIGSFRNLTNSIPIPFRIFRTEIKNTSDLRRESGKKPENLQYRQYKKVGTNKVVKRPVILHSILTIVLSFVLFLFSFSESLFSTGAVGTGTLSAAEKTSSRFKGNSECRKDKKIVLVNGEEEYRSEESIPQLAKILAMRHGFDTVVLYPINRTTGTIDPLTLDNIPDLSELRDADLLIMSIRFRALPDSQMKEFDDYLKSGRPILALRTSTHGFNTPATGGYSHYSWNYKGQGDKTDWTGGFGRRVLGETWINHYGKHGVEGTKLIPESGAEQHPILRGVENVVVPTDVYQVRLPLPGDSTVLARGAVLKGLDTADQLVVGSKNDPMMPIVWTKSYQLDGGKTGRALTTTMGSGLDLRNEGFRRLLVNASYWLLDLSEKIPAKVNVELVGPYAPLPYGFGKFRPNQRPE